MDAAGSTVSELIRIDPAAETERIVTGIRDVVFNQLRRRGAVIGLSGGIDSTVVAYLCALALGKERVQLVFMPEVDSSADSLRLGQLVAGLLGVKSVTEDISPVLAGARCYERQRDAVRLAVPEYGDGYKFKIVLPGLADSSRYSIFSIVVQAPDGQTKKVRLNPDAYLGIVAATNDKQRVRKMTEYYYADLLQYAVAGTPNKLEYDLGFFVKNGDGSADVKPIAHLYKSQVYQLAAHLGVPEEIQTRPSTTETYSLDQSQEEFYFKVPLEKMDLCLHGHDHGMSAADLSPIVGLSAEDVERVYRTIDGHQKVAKYLLAPPLLVK
jgi:NAD+ synthase